MKVSKQLITLHKFESDKEQKAIQNLQQARGFYESQKSRLEGVENYRLEYMRNFQNNADKGMTAASFSHFHSFLKKLDEAYLSQQHMVGKAKQVVDQRQREYLAQQQKLRSVELLIDNQKKAIAAKEAKNEQKMFDEFAMQQFYRRQMADA